MKATKAQVRKMSIGQIAATVPYAAQLFYRYKLDFCCHGTDSLDEACRKKEVNEDELLEELQSLMKQKDKTEWRTMNEQDLIQHILDAYHADLHQVIPEIQRLAQKVETVHADHRECPIGLSEELRVFWNELKAHLEKEENSVFPTIEAGKSPSGGKTEVQEVMREHVEQGEHLQKIRRICRGFILPEKACKSWRSLYLSLEHLERELMEHIHVENNVLFERALGRDGPLRAHG